MPLSDDEALVNEVTRLEGELLQVQKARRDAEDAQRTAIVTQTAQLEALRAEIAALEAEAANLEREVLGERVERDAAVNAATRAEAHLEELKSKGATNKAPVKHW